jgi:predicted metal-dependent hydrolase
VDDAYKRGLDLVERREYFAAHEELETAWRAAADEERDFFQGLVHVAVAWYQAGRGRPVATARQLEKAARRLGPFAPAHRGLDVADVLAQVERARGLVAGGSLELEPPRLRDSTGPGRSAPG